MPEIFFRTSVGETRRRFFLPAGGAPASPAWGKIASRGALSKLKPAGLGFPSRHGKFRADGKKVAAHDGIVLRNGCVRRGKPRRLSPLRGSMGEQHDGAKFFSEPLSVQTGGGFFCLRGAEKGAAGNKKEAIEDGHRPGSYPGVIQRRNAGRSPQATEVDSPAILPG